MPVTQIKNLLVLYVGGTIGMKLNDDGVYVPVPNEFLDKLKSIPQLHDPDLANKYFPDIKVNQLVLPQFKEFIVSYKLKEYDQLLDSSNMTPSDWIKIAKDIGDNYNNFDGIVILHGTDTLSFTASALSFMIEGLKKPVILTAAQISIFEPRSDAIDNILCALILCGCYQVPEICIFFANKLLRGNRTSKVNLAYLAGFDTPNYGVLGRTEVDITIYNDRLWKSDDPFKVNTTLNDNVAILTFSPTITASVIESFLQPPLSGAVLRSYGAGNIPSNQTNIVQVLKDAVKRGVLIVNTTNCLQGSVAGIYETGKVLEDIGIISGNDMTPEAALTKLCVTLGNPQLTYEQRVEIIQKNIRGELTPLSDKRSSLIPIVHSTQFRSGNL